MTMEEVLQIGEDLVEECRKFEQGEIEDDWDPEVRAVWTDKCNS